MFLRILNLQIYDLFSQNFHCFVFLQDGSFHLRSKNDIKMTLLCKIVSGQLRKIAAVRVWLFAKSLQNSQIRRALLYEVSKQFVW